jgi:FkbM family methyltransferase
LMWRLGRKMYTYARGDGKNDPRTNGEYWLLEQVLKASPGPQILLDVGANRGDWTAQALRLTQASKEVHVHAFEPSLATRSMLAARFAESVAVTVHPYALSETVGEATFYSKEVGAGTNSLSPLSGLNTEVVKLITIDRFFQHSRIEKVSLVKIDTEGFDLHVLRGAEESLYEGRIAVIQFEYNWRWLLNRASLRDVFDLISNKPYRLGKLVGKTIELYHEWHFELDRYFENNYVLVRRDSEFCLLGVEVHFDNSNALAISGLGQSVWPRRRPIAVRLASSERWSWKKGVSTASANNAKVSDLGHWWTLSCMPIVLGLAAFTW